MNLKRTLLMACVMGLSTTIIAQNSAVTNASMSLKSAKEYIAAEELEKAAKELGEAAAYIEPATAHEKTMGKEKTWRYRGDIYQMISRNMDKPEFASIADGAVAKAGDSYKKAMELDTKGSYAEENKRGLAIMQNLAVNNGINMFNANKFTDAFKLFEQGAVLAEAIGVQDTLAVFNAALSADRGGDDDNAIKYYQKAIDMDYNMPDMFAFMRNAYIRKGDKAGASAALDAGLKKYPSDQGLLIEKVNELLEAKDMDGAAKLLEKTVAQEPDNPKLQYSVGSVYDNLGQTEKARAAYAKALELDGSMFDANYNMGASHYNEAVEMINTCNEIAPSKVDEFNACKKSADGIFEQALPYLQQALESNPDDRATMASLVEIYTRTNKLQMAKELRDKMGN